MAEVILGALQKLQSLYGIGDDVVSLSRELKYIQAFMIDADRKHIVEERQMQWVKDIIDIAYDIEDVVDDFLEQCLGNSLEEGSEEHPSLMNRLKGLVIKIPQLPFLSNFEAEIKRIQHRTREIQEYRERYEISTLGEEDIGGPSYKKRKLDLDLIGDPEIVGFARDTVHILECLLDGENKSRSVVSIVGIGGLGKTTLARKVCKW